jgi:uncharacterized damage-inducible protein DinB
MTNKEFFIKTWQQEFKRTLSAVKGLPTEMEQLDYRPNELSRSAHEIIGHILPHAENFTNALSTQVVAEDQKEYTSVQEAYDQYETAANRLAEELANVDDDRWNNETLTLTVGGRKIFDAKMSEMGWIMLFDTVHHRGQLSTYYRAMGVRNPAIYGPTAEDMRAMAAAMQEQ